MRHEVSRVFKEIAGASIGWSVFMIFLGFIAVILPLITGIAVPVIVAWVALLSGLAYVVSSVADQNAGAFIWRLLIGLLYLTGGGYLAFHPQIALEALALLMAVIFSIEGILEIVSFFQFRSYAGSVWALFDGAVSMLMAFLIVFPWPNYSPWMVGVILGSNLMITGFTVLIYSFATCKTIEELS
jgi:uncharacterized membrane protein HdeD (DUF308 family)